MLTCSCHSASRSIASLMPRYAACVALISVLSTVGICAVHISSSRCADGFGLGLALWKVWSGVGWWLTVLHAQLSHPAGTEHTLVVLLVAHTGTLGVGIHRDGCRTLLMEAGIGCLGVITRPPELRTTGTFLGNCLLMFGSPGGVGIAHPAFKLGSALGQDSMLLCRCDCLVLPWLCRRTGYRILAQTPRPLGWLNHPGLSTARSWW